MVKLLVNTPAGDQEVIEVTATGSYFDDDRVLWDERRDGPLPEITLGGMVRERIASIVNHPAEMGDDGRGEYTQVSAAWDEEVVTLGELYFDQSVYDARPIPAAVPVTVTMAQARKALILSGVSMMEIEAALSAIPDDTARALAQADWEYSTTVRSTSTLVDSICSVMELDKAALFALAVTL